MNNQRCVSSTVNLFVMRVIEEAFWRLHGSCFVLFVVTSFIIGRLSRRFLMRGKVRQSFSIFDPEFPSRSMELVKLLLGIDDLPLAEEARASKAALPARLRLDFLFMLRIYPLFFCCAGRR